MKSIKLKPNQPSYSQETIDLKRNVSIRFYHLEEGFGFRFVSYRDGKEYDPMKDSAFSWMWGPIDSLEGARLKAIEFYRTLVATY